MPGRKFTAANSYRYGFNGKENDNEVKGEGNQQDYGMRISDPRLGRFLSVDPITQNYPALTPYQFASNSPIKCIDLDGLEGDPVGEFNLWMGEVWDDLRSAKRWTEAAKNVNETLNPLYIGTNHASKIVFKKDMLGNSIDSRGRLGAVGDLGVDIMAYLTVGRFFKTWSSYGTNAFEAELNNAKKIVTPTVEKPKVGTSQTALQVTTEQKQKIIAYLKQNSSTGNLTSTQSITAKMTTPQTGFEFSRIGFELNEGLFKARGKGLKGTYDFVITNEGRLLLGKGHYHLSGGASSVKAAGQIQMWDGKVKNINNSSGHYQPTADEARNFGEMLKSQGVNVSGASLNIYTSGSKVAEKIKL